eukprot:scaffold165484_cov31-Tisochrysis_lutea.AAC.3
MKAPVSCGNHCTHETAWVCAEVHERLVALTSGARASGGAICIVGRSATSYNEMDASAHPASKYLSSMPSRPSESGAPLGAASSRWAESWMRLARRQSAAVSAARAATSERASSSRVRRAAGHRGGRDGLMFLPRSSLSGFSLHYSTPTLQRVPLSRVELFSRVGTYYLLLITHR